MCPKYRQDYLMDIHRGPVRNRSFKDRLISDKRCLRYRPNNRLQKEGRSCLAAIWASFSKSGFVEVSAE